MCGIFGFVASNKSSLSKRQAKYLINQLFRLSESRGKEASGVAFHDSEGIRIIKKSIPSSNLIKGIDYQKALVDTLNTFLPTDPGENDNQVLTVIGHSRLVTNGSQKKHFNNQPVISEGMVGIHNGIITNVEELWKINPDLKKKYDIDTELMLCLIRKYIKQGNSIIESVQKSYAVIEGATTVAILFEDYNILLLATNNGSLYYCPGNIKYLHVFGSENFILKKIINANSLNGLFDVSKAMHIESGVGIIIDISSLEYFRFGLKKNVIPNAKNPELLIKMKKIIDITEKKDSSVLPIRIPGEGPYIIKKSFIDQFPINRIQINKLRRCTKCLLPETMPFIEYDKYGVCNYCRNYKKTEVRGINALYEAVLPYRKKNGTPDCVVTFSGGRDSSYGVHLVKKVLEMNPVTYTYDWGMVTDLARRNQMRICGKLGVEHILVSADIAKKRNNIRKNVLAWLKNPDLGTIPLFMSGDKQYFYYANRVGVQTNCSLIILCENQLETTRFKSGYCGVPPFYNSDHTYTLSLLNKIKMVGYYGRQFILNPAYLNSSILDTLSAFASYYIMPHNYLNIFDYIKWDEKIISSTIINEYNWEKAKDTDSTWRIGDGTASFYNYIYYTMAGLTENDTFRSNQIREGIISREKAIKLVEEENVPRYESIQWYCDIIGLNFEEVIKVINNAPKLYQNV